MKIRIYQPNAMHPFTSDTHVIWSTDGCYGSPDSNQQCSNCPCRAVNTAICIMFSVPSNATTNLFTSFVNNLTFTDSYIDTSYEELRSERPELFL